MSGNGKTIDNPTERNMDIKNKIAEENAPELWPALPFEVWKDTCETLHMWTQIVGKVRLELSPYMNHWWQVPLYVTARGLTTSSIPYNGRIFEVNFDFIDHNLLILTSDGTAKAIPLIARSVADFYQEFMASLRSLDIQIQINTLPCEVPNPIHCDRDDVHASYDPAYVHRFWRILIDRKSTRLNSSHANISYAVFCLKKKKISFPKI